MIPATELRRAADAAILAADRLSAVGTELAADGQHDRSRRYYSANAKARQLASELNKLATAEEGGTVA